MRTAADQYMYIQPIRPGTPSIAPGKNTPVVGISQNKARSEAIERPLVAASLLIRAAAVLLAGASVLAVLKLFLGR